MKEYESSETKYLKGTYTASCYTANNKKAATKSPKNKHNKVLDMLLLVMEVNLRILIWTSVSQIRDLSRIYYQLLIL